MQIHRRSIICTLVVCILTLIVSIVIVNSESSFKGAWFTFSISLTISIFASALLILIISIISYLLTRRHAAQEYVQLLCDIIETQAIISLVLQDNELTDGKIALRKSQIQAVDKLFDSLTKQQKILIRNDRIAWPRPSFLLRYSLKKKNSVFSTESTLQVSLLHTLEESVKCHICLNEILYLDGQKQQDSIRSFVTSCNNLNGYFKKGGQLEVLSDLYIQTLNNL